MPKSSRRRLGGSKITTQLESLYTSFTKIEPVTIVSVCSSLPNLKLLDVSGIQLTIEHCANILTDHLQYYYLSLESDEDVIWTKLFGYAG